MGFFSTGRPKAEQRLRDDAWHAANVAVIAFSLGYTLTRIKAQGSGIDFPLLDQIEASLASKVTLSDAVLRRHAIVLHTSGMGKNDVCRKIAKRRAEAMFPDASALSTHAGKRAVTKLTQTFFQEMRDYSATVTDEMFNEIEGVAYTLLGKGRLSAAKLQKEIQGICYEMEPGTFPQ